MNNRKGRTRETINPVFDHFIMVSPKQIEFAIYIRQYRRIHKLSLEEMASICTCYGKDRNIKITHADISRYENCMHVPTPKKFNVIMNTMDLDPCML